MNGQNSFEARLARLPVCGVPAEWRAEILSRAEPATGHSRAVPSQRVRTLGPIGALGEWLAEALWPAPRAWAGLAALWAGIALLHFASSEPASASRGAGFARAVPPSPAVRELLREQERLLAEVSEPAEPPPVGRRAPGALPPRGQVDGPFANI